MQNKEKKINCSGPKKKQKKLSNKQLFRLIAFQFRTGLGEISIEQLATTISDLYYPLPAEEYYYLSSTKSPSEQNSKYNFQHQIMNAFKQFSHDD